MSVTTDHFNQDIMSSGSHDQRVEPPRIDPDLERYLPIRKVYKADGRTFEKVTQDDINAVRLFTDENPSALFALRGDSTTRLRVATVPRRYTPTRFMLHHLTCIRIL